MTTEREVKFVDLVRQYRTIKAEVDNAIAGVLKRGDFILGEDVYRFEEELAAYCDAQYAVAVDNGTSALELGLRALNIGVGDEVIVPVNSFIASASAVSFTGAQPVFVDIDPVSYALDVSQIAARITERTKAIMPVHLYGQPVDMDGVRALADRFGLFVIEDACQAHGARYWGQRVGTLGHVGAFSFYPGKNLGAYGDGGAVVTDDSRIAEAVRTMRNCGQREKYHHVCLSWNRRLDTLQAAVLRVKLRYLDEWNARRRQLARLYDEALKGTGVVTPATSSTGEHVFHLYVIQVAERDGLKRFLEASGIATGIHYPIPIHLQPAYASLGHRLGDFPVAERCAGRLLSLPMFPDLHEDEVLFVGERIRTFMKERGGAPLEEPREAEMGR